MVYRLHKNDERVHGTKCLGTHGKHIYLKRLQKKSLMLESNLLSLILKVKFCHEILKFYFNMASLF